MICVNRARVISGIRSGTWDTSVYCPHHMHRHMVTARMLIRADPGPRSRALAVTKVGCRVSTHDPGLT